MSSIVRTAEQGKRRLPHPDLDFKSQDNSSITLEPTVQGSSATDEAKVRFRGLGPVDQAGSPAAVPKKTLKVDGGTELFYKSMQAISEALKNNSSDEEEAKE